MKSWVLPDLEHFITLLIKKKRPNEPEDAMIIEKNSNKHLIEIFRKFGGVKNKIIN